MNDSDFRKRRAQVDPLISPDSSPDSPKPFFKPKYLPSRSRRRKQRSDKQPPTRDPSTIDSSIDSSIDRDIQLSSEQKTHSRSRPERHLDEGQKYHRPENPNEVWVRIKSPWPLRKRAGILSAFALIAILAVIIFSFIWVQRQLNPPGPEGVEVLVEIPDGASINDISRILTDKGVVSNFTVTRFWWRNAGPYSAGTYTFYENMSVNSAKRILDRGPIASFELITLPEGLWLSDIEQRMLAELPDFNKLELDAALRGNLIRSRYQPAEIDSLEGLLFADTYQIDESGISDEFGLVQRMVNKFDSVLDELEYNQAPALLGYSPYEVIIVASIVEEEARVPEDRAKIARVMYNRIANNMRLDVDATVLYAIGEHKSELTVTDLALDSPYNTRLNRGLPPTPISSPSRSALEAALYPAEGNWLFYALADANGSHYFTDDFDDFLDQVQKSRDLGLFE